MTHQVEPRKPRSALLLLPWRIVCFVGRTIRGLFVVMGVLAALAVVGYVEFESIVEAIDARYAGRIDAWLGTDKTAHRAARRSRVLRPAVGAGQRGSEDRRVHLVARAPDPDQRCRGHSAAVHRRDPRLRGQELLRARRDRQGRHRSRDGQAHPEGKPLRRVDADDADRQASARRHRPRVDRSREGRRHRHGAAHRARIHARAAAGQVREHALLRPRPIRDRSGEPRVFRQAGEGSRAAPGGVHRRADQQACAARSRVRDRSA